MISRKEAKVQYAHIITTQNIILFYEQTSDAFVQTHSLTHSLKGLNLVKEVQIIDYVKQGHVMIFYAAVISSFLLATRL